MNIIDFIVYALCDPRTHQIRYIGKSELGLSRPLTFSGYGKNADLRAWMHDLLVTGQSYVVIVLERATSVMHLSELEAHWIKVGSQAGWPLANKNGLERKILTPEERRQAIQEQQELMPDNKRWTVKAWRRDPEVQARLKASKINPKRPKT
jgi:hypothetical protein